MRSISIISVLYILVLTSCNPIDSNKLFSKMPSGHTGIKFKNLVVETDELNILTYGYIYNGGGVAVGDINNDGLMDLYFTGSMVGSRLYLNKGDFKFEEIAEKAGVFAEGLWNTGTAMADVNGDGLVDIYVCRSAAKDAPKRKNLLFINNGDLTFTEKANEYGLDDSGYSTEANFFDYDKDGDLDVFVLNHSVQPYSSFRNTSKELRSEYIPEYADRLYRNDNGKFTDVSSEAGIISSVLGFGLSVSVGDINSDNWPDMYISNDFHEHDFLYLNNGDGTFTESLKKYMGHTSYFSMGSDVADINGDGKLDIVTLDMLPEGNFRQKMVLGPDNYDKYDFLVKSDFHHQYMRNMLHINNGSSFSEVGQLSGIHATDWSWAPLLTDLDNDGLTDLFVTNGLKRDYTNMDFMNFAVQKRLEEMDSGVEMAIKDLLKEIPSSIEENYAYKNLGHLKFEKETTAWGLGGKSLSSGAAYVDLDNDGDYDLVVNNMDEEAFIYRNNSEKITQNNYLKIQLKGKDKNTLAIGSKIIVEADTLKLQHELYTSRGFQSSVDPSIIFGLGKVGTIGELKVIWPDGSITQKNSIAVNQTLQLDQNEATAQENTVGEIATLFTEITQDSLVTFNHKENRFIDFERELLLPHMLSTQGPKLAVSDVNGDGLKDIYIGGAQGQPGKMFLKKANGSYISSSETVFDQDRKFEDIGAVFFDANGDAQPDLYVVSGGNEYDALPGNYTDRLYINLGNGQFKNSSDQLPKMSFSGSCAVVGDVDGDGDQDLFIGGRLQPGKYPMAPNSQILLNDGKGNFSNASESILGENSNLGMVNDAVFTDFNADGTQDLIVVGEFTPVIFLANKNGKLVPETPEGLTNSEGWWNTITPIDVDNDGDMDYALGNFGQNSQLKASAEEPVTLYADDFDDNGSIDPILCCYLGGKNHPVFSKDDIGSQLAYLKSKYINFSDYASHTVSEILGEESLARAQKFEAHTFKTSILRNNGNGFTLEALPVEAQFAPIYAMVPFDIEGDGDMDLMLFGNFFDTRVKFGRYDANHGLVLTNDGNGRFTALEQTKTGMNITGQVRDAKFIDDSTFLVAQNNGPLLVFKTNSTNEK
ncbi:MULTISPECIES: VCBS repeat-containing protein [Flavobacteriaceae]|uniref:VCBS repeat-containing protein n=1 Tax=Flavobacteriaceae TaxID=49546 RepID=UPI00234B76BA|nr:VCBS repeat-containing protein [Muricauda sp. SP22]MDC6362901.1 VCBS repeat-containing protein [Muricauda sp. SP22]